MKIQVTQEEIEYAVDVMFQYEQSSTSTFQRKMKIGYNKAWTIQQILGKNKLIGPDKGRFPRDILVTRDEADEILLDIDFDYDEA